MSTKITLLGNIGRVELTFTAAGKALLKGTLAANGRKFNRTSNTWEDVEPDWHDWSIWENKAETLAEVLKPGTRIIVLGELVSRKVERDGNVRVFWDVKASEIGIVPKASGQGRPERESGGQQNDPWATSNNDSPPF